MLSKWRERILIDKPGQYDYDRIVGNQNSQKNLGSLENQEPGKPGVDNGCHKMIGYRG